MAFKAPVNVTQRISVDEKTVVKFNENEFTVVPNLPNKGTRFYIQNKIGDFDILSIEHEIQNQNANISFTRGYDSFTSSYITNSTMLVFTVYTNVRCKKMEYNERKVKVCYDLFISTDRVKVLNLYDYFEETFIMPGYEYIKLKYYIKRILEKTIEVFIENPFDIEIGNENKKLKDSLHRSVFLTSINGCETVCFTKNANAKKGHFQYEVQDTENIDLKLFFIFAPDDFKNFDTCLKPAQEPLISPEVSSMTPSTIGNPKFYEIMSDTTFFDVILYSSEQTEIRSHRCVLAKYSDIFKKVFQESTELPVKINIEEFNADIIQAALNFCYGKIDSIKDNAGPLLEFANKYSMKELQDACCYYCNEKVDPTNVCEVIQIAYSNNLEELKQKCKQIMIEKKTEIDQAKLKALPKDILFDVFCSF